jgi:hypothetical protein
MSTVIKILILGLCMNICLTLFGISVGSYDIMSGFMNFDGNTITPKDQFSLTSNNTAIPTDPNAAVGSITNIDNGSFIDTVRLTFSILLLILVGLFFPVYWGFALSLPFWLTMILAVQTIIGVIAVILVLRGVGS